MEPQDFFYVCVPPPSVSSPPRKVPSQPFPTGRGRSGISAAGKRGRAGSGPRAPPPPSQKVAGGGGRGEVGHRRVLRSEWCEVVHVTSVEAQSKWRLFLCVEFSGGALIWGCRILRVCSAPYDPVPAEKRNSGIPERCNV